MDQVAVTVDRISKLYRLGSLWNVPAWVGRVMRLAKSIDHKEDFWALRDVSFEVRRGEVVGLIGRNGAGKSTLLKILSQITEPTGGRVEIRGRVGSLLEVGTGFHPELTGRENIFLNGSILGMRRQEIKQCFSQIVDFAEIGPFLDTPVKRYSSGMYVRLAFAVAAHLRPEILLVDEVLAVGDASFQRRCLGKMGDVASSGRTVLFVSHNMASISALCHRCGVLDGGQLIYFGATDEAIRQYNQRQSALSTIPLHRRSDRGGSGRVQLTGIRIAHGSAPNDSIIHCGDPVQITVDYQSDQPLRRPRFLVGICDHMNVPLFRLDTAVSNSLPDLLPRRGSVTCQTGALCAAPGRCYLNVAVQVGEELADHVIQAATLDLEATDFYGSGRCFERRESLFLLEQEWEVARAA